MLALMVYATIHDLVRISLDVLLACDPTHTRRYDCDRRRAGEEHQSRSEGFLQELREDANVFDQLLLIVSVTFVVMISPGPDMVLVIRNTFVGGRRAGLRTSMGILSGNLVHITYCVLGIGLIISQSIKAFAALKYAAAAYLIYLGIMIFRSGDKRLETSDVEIGGPMEDGSFKDSSTISSTRKARSSTSACLRRSLGPTPQRAPWLSSSSA